MDNIITILKTIASDSYRILTQPKEYFSSLIKEGGYDYPLNKTLLYGFLSFIFIATYKTCNILPYDSFYSQFHIILLFFIILLIACIKLFILSLVIYLFSIIAKGQVTFESSLRISASMLVLYPLHAAFSFSSPFHEWPDTILSLMIILFLLWLTYNALKYTLNGKDEIIKSILIIIAIVSSLLIVTSLLTKI